MTTPSPTPRTFDVSPRLCEVFPSLFIPTNSDELKQILTSGILIRGSDGTVYYQD